MKFWQAVFAQSLRAADFHWACGHVEFCPLPPRLSRAIGASAVGTFSAAAGADSGAAIRLGYAFFQNLTALDDGESLQLRALVGKSIRQAALWPGQNHVVLLVLLAFGFLVFLNWTVFCVALPSLVKNAPWPGNRVQPQRTQPV